MREDLRKPVYGSLYYGTKAVCILIGLLASLLCLLVIYCVGWTWITSPSSDTGTFLEKISFSALMIPGISIAALVAWKALPLLQNFKEISPDKTEKIAFVLGVLAWLISEKLSFPLAKEWFPSILDRFPLFGPPPFMFPEMFFFTIPLIIGWGTYRVTYPALFIIGMRLQACDPKPDNPDAPGEAPQGERETV